MIAAFVISQGYDAWRSSHILEIDYHDFAYRLIDDKRRIHFFVECHASGKGFLDCGFDDIAVSHSRLAFRDQAVEFLSNRLKILKSLFPDQARIIFVFKGPVDRLLRDAGITDLMDLETLGVPATLWLDHIYQDEKECCNAHLERGVGAKRCARRVSRMVTRFLRSNGEFVERNLKKRGVEFWPKTLPREVGWKSVLNKNKRSDRILAGYTF